MVGVWCNDNEEETINLVYLPNRSWMVERDYRKKMIEILWLLIVEFDFEEKGQYARCE